MILDGILRVLALPLVLAASSAAQPSAPPAAEDWALRPTVPSEQADIPSCAPQAALYAAGGLKLWVTRAGAMRQENPLRPLSPDRHLVLQVSVNGRVATAYGPDYDNLRQGGSPQKLEEAAQSRIQWESSPEKLPATLRIVREDGTVLLGPLAFQSCGEAPRNPARAEGGRPATSPAGRAGPAPEGPRRLPPGFPQGAIQ